MNPLKRQPLAAAITSFVLLLGAAAGCGDSSDNARPPDVNAGGSNSSAGENSTAASSGKAGNGGKAGNAGSSSKAGTGNEGGSGNEAGAPTIIAGSDQGGASGAPPTPACTLPELGADGCFNCPKNGEVTQWLNRCADSDCEPFPNHDRLPLLKADGTLPDLPN